MRLAIIVKKDFGNFLDWVNRITGYETKIFYIEKGPDINMAVDWADIVWLEWMDDAAVYASRYKNIIYKKVIVRCHSYEAFVGYHHDINWDSIHHIVFVANNVKALLNPVIPNSIIPNGVDLDKFKFVDRERGTNLAFVGNISFKKCPMLLLHAFYELFKIDPEYKLYIAGACQELRFELYLNHMLEILGLNDNVFFQGTIKDMPKWLEDKHFVVCSSPFESQNMGIMEGMATGCKPLVHNFPGAKEIYSERYLWNDIEQFIKKVLEAEYTPIEYHDWVAERYPLEKTVSGIQKVIDELAVSLLP